jgi:SNF2 family DNA or RNA helicase
METWDEENKHKNKTNKSQITNHKSQRRKKSRQNQIDREGNRNPCLLWRLKGFSFFSFFSFLLCLEFEQKECVRWLWDLHHRPCGGGILADDMGLGKTVQSCAFVEALAASNECSRVLIISPAAVIPNWWVILLFPFFIAHKWDEVDGHVSEHREKTANDWCRYMKTMSFHSKLSDTARRNIVSEVKPFICSSLNLNMNHWTRTKSESFAFVLQLEDEGGICIVTYNLIVKPSGAVIDHVVTLNLQDFSFWLLKEPSSQKWFYDSLPFIPTTFIVEILTLPFLFIFYLFILFILSCLVPTAADLARLDWDYVICDEAHTLKNHLTATFKSIRAIQSKHRVLLTGTPIQNKLTELWALFEYACDSQLLGSIADFKRTCVLLHFIDCIFLFGHEMQLDALGEWMHDAVFVNTKSAWTFCSYFFLLIFYACVHTCVLNIPLHSFETPIVASSDRRATERERQLGEDARRELQKLITPYYLRREKAEVMQVWVQKIILIFSSIAWIVDLFFMTYNSVAAGTQTVEQREASESTSALAKPEKKMPSLTIGKKEDHVIWITLSEAQVS